jgi:oligopeptidase B
VLVSARRTDRQYDVDERESTLYIRVNDMHSNFRVVTAPVSTPGDWTELIEGHDRHYILSVTTFENLLVIEERVDGLSQIRLRDYLSGAERYIAFPEASFVAALSHNPEYRVDRLRIGYESMVTPNTVYDYHLADQRLETLKVREIPSGYDASKYANERLMAPARDGSTVGYGTPWRGLIFPPPGGRPYFATTSGGAMIALLPRSSVVIVVGSLSSSTQMYSGSLRTSPNRGFLMSSQRVSADLRLTVGSGVTGMPTTWRKPLHPVTASIAKKRSPTTYRAFMRRLR